MQYQQELQQQLFMIDNFFQQNYISFNRVYTHPLHHHHIYIGDVQSAMDNHFHSTHSIHLIVTAARDMHHIVVAPDITHIRYDLLDGKKENIQHLFDQFYELVQHHIVQTNILVHCAAGISRSSTLVISYVIKKEKMTFKDAIALVRKGRPSVLPNLGFERQLKRYEQKIKREKQSRSTKRSEVKTSQSRKYKHGNQSPLQFYPQISLSAFKQQPYSAKKPFERLSEKDLQIFKIYGRGNNSIQNKAGECIKNNIRKSPKTHQISLPFPKTQGKEVPFIHRTIKYHRKYQKRMKTSIQQIRQIYLQRKKRNFQVLGCKVAEV